MKPPRDARHRAHHPHRTTVPEGRWLTSLATGIGALILVLVLGLLALLPAVTGLQQGVGTELASDRTVPLTTAAYAINASAAPATVGLGATLLLPTLFLLHRRRLAATQTLGVLGGALGIAHVLKIIVNEPRPPDRAVGPARRQRRLLARPGGAPGSCSLTTWGAEVAVDGGAGGPELGGDLGDGVAASARAVYRMCCGMLVFGMAEHRGLDDRVSGR